MFTGKLFAISVAFVFLTLVFQNCNASDSHVCGPSSCGSVSNIKPPFRLQTDPPNCGDFRYNLSCENNVTMLHLFSGKYHVKAINYDNFTIRVADAGLQEDDCSSTPRFPLSTDTFEYSYKLSYTPFKKGTQRTKISKTIVFLRCADHALNHSSYLDTAPCINGTNSSKMHAYVNVAPMYASELMEHCTIETMSLLPAKDYSEMSFNDIHREMTYGFELSWQCGTCRKGCFPVGTDQVACFNGKFQDLLHWIEFVIYTRYFQLLGTSVALLIAFVQVAKTLCGCPFVFGFLIYKWRRRHLSVYDTVEEFLQNHNNLMPVRYSYSDIKKMTGGFKDKLGEGGFGKVYKGKLRSGNYAAVKMLSKTKANGQEFINEVATIGRIHHVNVVQLIGFCVEGSKRALVYDFMPNGSLDKYIFSQEESISLSWKELYEISLGVARGIEYLHRGCDIQILHFDIKPHNILLDENFSPKVSDFGLAKLYATDKSIMSLTAIRGTIGYMAPELFYKNIGGVSYKADVYSFGMLLLDMAGKTKNSNAQAENTTKYFPFWVHDEITTGKAIETGGITEKENQMAKKMVVVGLWCIQMNPSNRPSMNKVVEMLEGDLESLQLPPSPALYTGESRTRNGSESSSSSSISLNSITESTSLIMSFNHESMSGDKI